MPSPSVFSLRASVTRDWGGFLETAPSYEGGHFPDAMTLFLPWSPETERFLQLNDRDLKINPLSLLAGVQQGWSQVNCICSLFSVFQSTHLCQVDAEMNIYSSHLPGSQMGTKFQHHVISATMCIHIWWLEVVRTTQVNLHSSVVCWWKA